MFNILKKTVDFVKGCVSNVAEKGKAFGLALVGLAVANGVPASATTFTAPTLSTDEPTQIAIVVVTALGALWGLVKAVGMMKRG